MREPIRDRGRLEHIQTAVNYILSFTKDKTLAELSSDKVLFFAVVKNIEIIGEAAYKLSELYRSAHSETPWAYIIKMRHVLVHDYYQISPREAWKVVYEDLPPLAEQIDRYLTETDWDAWEQQDFDYAK